MIAQVSEDENRGLAGRVITVVLLDRESQTGERGGAVRFPDANTLVPRCLTVAGDMSRLAAPVADQSRAGRFAEAANAGRVSVSATSDIELGGENDRW